MKKYIFTTLIATSLWVTSALAVVPSLSVSSQSGTNYSLNISGDPNQSVILYFHQNTNPSVYTSMVIGSTNGSGTLSYVFNTNTYNVVANDQIYTIINSQSSAPINLNNPSGGTNNTLSLSQTTLNLNANQQGVVTAYNMTGNLSVTSGNTNVATVYANSSNIYITGVNQGTTTITVSGTNTSNQYVTGTIQVTVSGTSTGTMSLSQTSIALNPNQQGTVYAYNIASNLNVSSSNNSVATASVSGSTINIYGVAQGTAYIYVSGTNTSNQSVSGTITVTVNGNTNGTLSLSQTSLTLSPQQTSTIAAYNVNSSLSAVSNNNSIATVSVNGSNINIYGVSPGNVSISVSGYGVNNQYLTNTIYVTVSGTTVNPGNGPWTVNVCGYSGYKYICKNVTVNSYEEYLYLTQLNKSIGGNLKYPSKYKTRANQSIQARINLINKRMQERMNELNRRIGNINMRY